jgi:hypothetical protein
MDNILLLARQLMNIFQGNFLRSFNLIDFFRFINVTNLIDFPGGRNVAAVLLSVPKTQV